MSKCKSCGCDFVKSRPLQSVCDWKCAQSLTERNKASQEAKKAKAERKETREKLEKLKTKPQLQNEYQKVFNAIVRELCRGLPCISCKKPDNGEARQAGHYLSVGSRANLRFEPNNCHSQCVRCNLHLHGNLINYRIGLIEKIGLEAVEALENDHRPRHYTREELIVKIKEGRAYLKELKNAV